jgi:type II secretory pathway component GspD/PulD (secretin)
METQEVTQKTNTLVELDQNRICPICGSRYNTVEKRKIKDQVYIYFVHKIKDENGKIRIHKCYAGAKESYKYVQKFQNNSLTLKGNPSNYEKYSKVIDYLDSILSSVESQKEYEEFKNEIIRLLWKYEKRFYQKPKQKPSQ